jgi:cobalamin biosynthesis Co2+ chelatase CbiK
MSLAVFPSFLLAGEILEKYPAPTYQDVLVRNEVVGVGTNICADRYEMIKHIFGLYQRPFKVLEIGAAQGYFSFRIANDYPLAHCIMIEEDNDYYAYHGRMLLDLCRLNNHLGNISLLRKKISMQDLEYLSSAEHFDVVMVFLVIHQLDDDLHNQMKILELLLKMGDHVIIELADDAAPLLTAFAKYKGRQLNFEYLGEVKRFKDPAIPHIGKFFWFKPQTEPLLNEETLRRFNRVYPE